MFLIPAFRRVVILLSLAGAPSLSFAVDTHVWEQSDQSDFSRGTLKHVALRSDGHLSLSPDFKELDSTTIPYLWAIARDHRGTIYYAGGAPTGATAKVMALSPGGKPRTVAELPGLEIHALAIDAKDRVYAAVLPDAKIYRINPGGKFDLFFDPHCKYIWSMLFDKAGHLFVATGDSGIVFRVDNDGKGTEFARTEETHARSMLLDSAGNLIVGTEPGGLVVRISPAGEKFVLFQTRKREVTALAEHEGHLYAAAVGIKPATVTGTPPVLPSNPAPIAPTGTPHVNTTPPSPAPPVGSFNASVTGGSDLYRIEPDGFSERLWESGSDVVYAITFDAAGHPLIGTGNKGIIYRIDSNALNTELLNAPPTQVTAFLPGDRGLIYAITGNVGNLYSIGPGLQQSGALDSEVFDASEFSDWGKIHITDVANGGVVKLETRSGNLNNPQHDWSSWASVPVDILGGQIPSPPARFLQYRLTLSASGDGRSPDVNTIDVPYLPRNVAPRVDQVEIAPVNYKQSTSPSLLERSVEPSGSPASLSLPAIGQKRSSTSPSLTESAGAATLQYSKGFVTVRWSASDANHDPLLFNVEIRAKNQKIWRMLKENWQDTHFSFDSAAFPDGEYVLRVSATDAPGNTPTHALNASLESDSFTIDNTPPEILNLHTDIAGGRRSVKFTAKDALSWIAKVEYSANGADWILLEPSTRVTDSQVLSYDFQCDPHQLIAVRVFDDDDNVTVKTISPE